MDDAEKASFTLEAAKEMVEDQIQIDKDHGRKPLEYDPELFYDTMRVYPAGCRGRGLTYILPGIPGCSIAACYPPHRTVIYSHTER